MQYAADNSKITTLVLKLLDYLVVTYKFTDYLKNTKFFNSLISIVQYVSHSKWFSIPFIPLQILGFVGSLAEIMYLSICDWLV